MKVLFVQENPFLSASIQRILSLRGYQIIFSTGKINANTIIADANPQLVIADISKANGISFVNAAKRKNIPVIVISENGNEEKLQQAFDLGADDYVSLPLTLKELSMRIDILTTIKCKMAA